MKKKILEKWNYLLSGFLGFWGLAFMASSGLITKTLSFGMKNSWSIDMYTLIAFDSGTAAISAAAVFQIFMIMISIVLLVLCVAQILNLHGVKIPYADKVYKINFKGFDLVTILVACYALFSLVVIICLAVAGSQNSVITNANNYMKVKIGFGPIWLFLSSLIVLAAIVFKDKIIPLLVKEKKQPVKAMEDLIEKLEDKIDAINEPKKEEPKAEEKKVEPKVEEKKVEPKVEEKKVEPKVEKPKAESKSKTQAKAKEEGKKSE